MVKRLLTTVAAVLGDRFMGLLGILAVASSFYRVLFKVEGGMADVLDWVEWAIVILFAAEYLVYLVLAPDRKAFFWNGWRLLDLGIIIVCFLTVVPKIDSDLRRTLSLRILWILRAFGIGLRVRRREIAATVQVPFLTPRSFSVHWEESWKTIPLSWSEFVEHAATRSEGWLDAFDVDGRHLEELATALKMPPALFGILRGTSSYPRLKVIGGRLVATLWLPLVKQDGWVEVDRVSALLSLSEHGPLLTIAPTDCQLQQRIARWLAPDGGANVETLAVEAYVRMVLEQNEEALAHLETGLRQMEIAPVARVGEEFFRLAFRLRRDLSQIKADLWRLGGILDAIKTNRLHLPRHGKTAHEAYIVLSDQADYLYETASNLGEELISLLELHMNTLSMRTNSFMQLLAVVTVLAAIPATVGGLLGMNILGTPWQVTLGQVAFGVGLAVTTVLYLFLSSERLG